MELNAQDATVVTEETSTPAAEEKTEQNKNKAATPIYETVYNKDGKKEVRAYQWGYKLKEQVGSKENKESVHYEKTPDGGTTAYKWGYQLKDQLPKQVGSAPKGGTLTHKKPAPASTASSSAPDMEEEEMMAPPSAEASSGGSDLKQKILDMIKAQKASE